jgi:hypothetical protein
MTPPIATPHPLLQDLRTMDQTIHSAYKTIGSDIKSSAASLGSTYGAAFNQLDAVVAAYEAQYCTPAKYTPPTKMFAEFTGHKFELFLSSGKCVVNETLLLGELTEFTDFIISLCFFSYTGLQTLGQFSCCDKLPTFSITVLLLIVCPSSTL